MLKHLNNTDLKVSRLCLGTMTFGKPAGLNSAKRMVDQSLDAGINFFDTANAYQLGIAEQMLGEALKGRRKEQVIATKVCLPMGDSSDDRGLSRRAILKAVEASLKRLQTDYLDIYYLHCPDYSAPIEETLGAMEELRRSGKIRYAGTSNYAAWQQTEILNVVRDRGYLPVVVTQPMYNLLARSIEQEWLPMTKHFGLSNIVYNPLAGGLLTGKHRMESVIAGTRFDNNQMYQDRYWHTADFEAVEKLKAIAVSAGRSLLSLALNWLLHHTAADCVILGASRPEQLSQNLAACEEGPLSTETIAACDDVWRAFRGPVPAYNR